MISTGKKFEAEFKDAGRLLRAYDHNSNSQIPQCDWSMTVPIQAIHRSGDRFAASVHLLIECKEADAGVLKLPPDKYGKGGITANERKCLTRHRAALGLSFLAIKHVQTDRAFIAEWDAWLAHEAAIGFVLDLPICTRRKPGTASVSLLDGLRPGCLTELARVPVAADSYKRCWDLRPAIQAELQARWPGFEVPLPGELLIGGQEVEPW